MSARTNIIGSLLGWGAALLLAASAVAGVVLSVDNGPLIDGKRTRELTAVVTSATNVVQIGTIALDGGNITKVVTVPGSGASQPAAAYDCAVYGRFGENLTGAAMSDRVNTNTQAAPAYTAASEVWYPPIWGSVGVSCWNMGTGGAATVRVYWQ